MKPFCVVLTHRHGACMGILPTEAGNPPFVKSNFIQTAQSYLSQKSAMQTHENFEFFYEKNSFAFARVLGKTAENLSNLFQFSCGLMDNNCIKDFIVGTGPGSFTGLRLGCAFVNGLHLGSGSTTNLFSVSTPLVDDLHNELKSDDNLSRTFFDELGTYHPNDPSSGYVTFFDLLYVLHQVFQKNTFACQTLTPNYSRAPAAVLNLRKE